MLGNLMEEIEMMIRKIWNLYDKLSDTIHSISRCHFLNSIKKSNRNFYSRIKNEKYSDANRFQLDFSIEDNLNEEKMMSEIRSLNEIRSALENLEDNFVFLRIVNSPRQEERNAVNESIEQSLILLSTKLDDYQGRQYPVIEEILALVREIQNMGSHFTTRDSTEVVVVARTVKRSNLLTTTLKCLIQVKRSLHFIFLDGLFGNVTRLTIGVLALLQVHGILASKKNQEISHARNHRSRHGNHLSLGGFHESQLNVFWARG